MDFDIKKYEDEAKEITDFLSKPDAFSDSSFASKSKRLSELNDILALGREIEQMKKNIAEATELLSEPDFAEMAKADIDEANKKIAEDSEKLEKIIEEIGMSDVKDAVAMTNQLLQKLCISTFQWKYKDFDGDFDVLCDVVDDLAPDDDKLLMRLLNRILVLSRLDFEGFKCDSFSKFVKEQVDLEGSLTK